MAGFTWLDGTAGSCFRFSFCGPPMTGVVEPDVGVGVGKPSLGWGNPGDGVLHSLDELPGISSIGLSVGEPF